jgi:primary-amine oxidase
MFGATNSTDLWWQEYVVGPLPATNATKVETLNFPFNNQQAGRTNVHPVYSANDGALFQTKLSSDVQDITKQLWNSVSQAS